MDFMHNQDTAKDDFMEALMELLAKLKDHYFTKKEVKEKEVSEEKPEEKVSVDDEKVLRFQRIMKEVISETNSEELAKLAKTFHDNPVESMKMLSAVVTPEVEKLSAAIVNATTQNMQLLEGIRNNLDPSNEKSLTAISMINSLITNEQKKLDVTNTIASELNKEQGHSAVAEVEQFELRKRQSSKELDGPER